MLRDYIHATRYESDKKDESLAAAEANLQKVHDKMAEIRRDETEYREKVAEINKWLHGQEVMILFTLLPI